MSKVLTILLCACMCFILAALGAFIGHHFKMIVLEQFSHAIFIELAICSVLGTVCLLSILTLQLIKIMGGFKLWGGKYKTYLSSIEKEAQRIEKQKEALENGK